MTSIPNTLLNLPSHKLLKKSNDCLVVEAQNAFYKIRLVDENDPNIFYEKVVLQAFAEVYNEMNLEWEFFVANDETATYYVEKREKLKVLRPCDCSLETAVEQSAKVVRKVEKKLGFSQLTAQVVQAMGPGCCQRVCIARDCELSLDDFALTPSGNIVSLGDTKMFLSLIKDDGTWNYNVVSSLFKVEIKHKSYYFAPQKIRTKKHKFVEKISSPNERWWLFSAEVGEKIQAQRNALIQEVEHEFSTNVKILSLKKPIFVKSREEYKEENLLFEEGREPESL